MNDPFLVDVMRQERLLVGSAPDRKYVEESTLGPITSWYRLLETGEGWEEQVVVISGRRKPRKIISIDTESRIVTQIEHYDPRGKVVEVKVTDDGLWGVCYMPEGFGIKMPYEVTGMIYDQGIRSANLAISSMEKLGRARVTPLTKLTRHYARGPVMDDIDAMVEEAFSVGFFGLFGKERQ